jgi:flavin-dependent dehydrogenase
VIHRRADPIANNFDALVIGGGPSGSAAALLLAQAGWSVALVERRVFPRRKVCGEYVSVTNLELLQQLGVKDAFCAAAGPEVTRVGLFAGRTTLAAPLPRPQGTAWGRALGRETLDSLLLARAARAGVAIWQPWSAVGLERQGDGYCCRASAIETALSADLHAPVVIAAHGSWEPGPLPTQRARPRARPGDLLGFKAHFRGAALPAGLMPLLAFPGGYGGMVHTDAGRVSLSCCIRRDRLALVRRQFGNAAGEALLSYLCTECSGVRQALDGASRDGEWLSAGPVRPGIRLRGGPGLLPVGNCAGEAHPAVAEGISMALQSSWLLARRLIAWRGGGGSFADLASLGEDYAAAWRRCFAPRVYASAALARWAMRPAAVAGVLPLLHWFPALLPWAARLSGKARRVVTA